MTANLRDSATATKDQLNSEETKIRRNLELIYIKLNERFRNFSAAFRFFDTNFNNRVSFNEFSRGMEALKVKITVRELLECFDYLDRDKNGYITYSEFCGLSSERRNDQDPATEMLNNYKKITLMQTTKKSDLASYLDKL